MPGILIADAGSTKTRWALLNSDKQKTFGTTGINPYFHDGDSLRDMLSKELMPKIRDREIDQIFYYGAGCSNAANVKLVKNALQKLMPRASIKVETDLTGAAKALCGEEKGIVSILGTGSNCGFYNGKKLVKTSPGLGYLLGDEGSGAYMGRRVLQYALYQTFEPELLEKFREKYPQSHSEFLDRVYRGPFPGRYLAGFTTFLSENRGHYMVENIIEDSLNDFFFTHVYKFREAWSLPLHFTGGVAWAFRDVLLNTCFEYELQPGTILREPLDGLIKYHRS